MTVSTSKHHTIAVEDPTTHDLLLRLHLSDFGDMKYLTVIDDHVASLHVASVGSDFAELAHKLADQHQRVVDAIRAIAATLQAAIDSPPMSLTPNEASIAVDIGRFIRDRCSSMSDPLHELAFAIEQGAWRGPRTYASTPRAIDELEDDDEADE